MSAIIESLFLFIANKLPRLEIFDNKRYLFLKLAGIKFTGPCKIFPTVEVRPIGAAKNITIGKKTFINTGVRFGTPNSSIKIGDRVLIGPRVMFETANHGLKPSNSGARGTNPKPINIEDNVWIGAGCIVLPGVTIGRNSVVAAGAVVNKSAPPNTLIGGVPARVIRLLE